MKQFAFKMKQFALFVCLLCATTAFTQPIVGMEAGNGIGINAGYTKGITVQAGLNAPYTRRADQPHIFYASVGYEFGNEFTIIPAVGISRYGITDFSKNDPLEINKTALLTSLDAGKKFKTISDHYGMYYLFARHSVRTFYGAGLRIFIK